MTTPHVPPALFDADGNPVDFATLSAPTTTPVDEPVVEDPKRDEKPTLVETVEPEDTDEPVDIEDLPALRPAKTLRLSEAYELFGILTKAEIDVAELIESIEGDEDSEYIQFDTAVKAKAINAVAFEKILGGLALDKDAMNTWLCEASEAQIEAAGGKAADRLGERLGF